MGTTAASQVYGAGFVSRMIDAEPNGGASSNATTGGLPETPGKQAAPAMVWVGMVGLLIALRLVWEFAGGNK